MYRKVVEIVNPKRSQHKKNCFFFSFFLLYLHEKLNLLESFHNDVNQTIMLCALNLYSDVCQLFLNKTGKK